MCPVTQALDNPPRYEWINYWHPGGGKHTRKGWHPGGGEWGQAHVRRNSTFDRFAHIAANRNPPDEAGTMGAILAVASLALSAAVTYFAAKAGAKAAK